MVQRFLSICLALLILPLWGEVDPLDSAKKAPEESLLLDELYAAYKAGKFEDTLPKFFSKKRPLASIINFDADLYSSTLCALNYSNKIIDKETILFFDEFITSTYWENDEYKALNEFCDNFNYKYEVIAVSFYSKQVAVKLISK